MQGEDIMGIQIKPTTPAPLADDKPARNPNLRQFKEVSTEAPLLKRGSVTRDAQTVARETETAEALRSPAAQTMMSAYEDITMLHMEAVPTNKLERLLFYRNMSTFPEVSDAIDEIADALFVPDEAGQYFQLKFSRLHEVSESARDWLSKEWEYFTSLFRFEENGYTYARNFVTDAELCWENLYHPKYQSHGLLGVKFLPAENYDFLRLRDTVENLGVVYVPSNPVSGAQNITASVEFLTGTGTAATQIDRFRTAAQSGQSAGVPLPWSQVTYLNSGKWSPSRDRVFPILDEARMPYNLLRRIEDALIVYRIARSPARFSFNVDVGNLPRQIAEQEVMRMARRFNTRKQVVSPNTGALGSAHDPLGIVESFWFMKPEGGTGTTVETIAAGEGANFSQLDDVFYYVEKLYRALRVPFRRRREPTPSVYHAPDSITYDEYKFAQSVIRMQRRFASALLESFRVHLKLRGAWERFGLLNTSFSAAMNQPVNYDLYRNHKLLQIKAEEYALFNQDPSFSKDLLKRRYLGWTDKELEENRRALREEAVFAAKLGAPPESGEVTLPSEETPVPIAPETPPTEPSPEA